jgi:hypothetical protein
VGWKMEFKNVAGLKSGREEKMIKKEGELCPQA